MDFLTVVESTSLPRHSDKCRFPASVLERTIAQNPSLPHPLVFRLGGKILVGVKEFTAPDLTIEVPLEVFDKLQAPTVAFELVSIEKATFLQCQPAQFYPHVINWKYYLESFLSTHYTTLSKGQVFGFHDANAGTDISMLVKDANADAVVVIDADIALDVVPLNDIMAAQQLAQDAKISSLENIPRLEKLASLSITPFSQGFAPAIFKVNLRATPEFTVHVSSPDIFNVDLICGLDKFLSLENFIDSTMAQDATDLDRKFLSIGSTPIITHALQSAPSDEPCWLYLICFAWEHTAEVDLQIGDQVGLDTANTSGDLVKCGNCQKLIPTQSFRLHEAFCLRNNIRCSCGDVFQKQIPAVHWHCEKCQHGHGISSLHKLKHERLFHSEPYICHKCDDPTLYPSLEELVTSHQSQLCAGKLHECRFCHLILTQGQATPEDEFQHLTHHESDCGSKTTECYECGRVVRNRDLASHLRIHEMNKKDMSSIEVTLCTNKVCVNIITDEENDLGLCSACYGPLYLALLDTTHKKLQSRIERRYVLQLTKGCGHVWCRNPECATGKGAMDFKQAISYVPELLAAVAVPLLPINENKPRPAKNTFWFCVSESAELKRSYIEQVVSEGEYSANVLYKAVSAAGTEGAREWLRRNAI